MPIILVFWLVSVEAKATIYNVVSCYWNVYQNRFIVSTVVRLFPSLCSSVASFTSLFLSLFLYIMEKVWRHGKEAFQMPLKKNDERSERNQWIKGK